MGEAYALNRRIQMYHIVQTLLTDYRLLNRSGHEIQFHPLRPTRNSEGSPFLRCLCNNLSSSHNQQSSCFEPNCFKGIRCLEQYEIRVTSRLNSVMLQTKDSRWTYRDRVVTRLERFA